MMGVKYLEAMQERLSCEEAQRLQAVYAPQVVGVPSSNTWMDMCAMPDGEIRHYGHRDGKRIYISSRDGGFTWKEYGVDDLHAMCSGLQSPYSGRWILSYFVEGEGGFQGAEMPVPPEGAHGWQAVLSDEGPGGAVRWVKITDKEVRCPRYPLALRARKRILIAAQLYERPMRPIVARTDDEGETWQVSSLEGVPMHEPVWPHEGPRWQNGSCEPTIVERADGSLLMLTRTSLDFHYQYESFDGGETWTSPQPSGFHGTLTMSTLLRMHTGEMVLFWCNTQPLPELDKRKIWPPMNEGEISGLGGEDVFTNRDANHAALSLDDGKTWRGFREVLLNPIRNDSDFRTSGGKGEALDKSVHQFQALEMPYGKILLSCGQHKYARRLILLDPKWLLETSREEDFAYGLENVSTQVYLKSVSGNRRVRAGHCAWNRTHGAVLMPDPDGNYEEALYICANADARLFSPMQGACWNFPAAHCGKVEILLQIVEEGVTATLTDRWFNPCDAFAGQLSPISCALSGENCAPGKWQRVTLQWDAQGCQVFVEQRLVQTIAAKYPFPNGLCYLLLQSAPQASGAQGTFVKSLRMAGEDWARC